MLPKYGNPLTELTLSEKPVSGLYDSKDLATAYNKAHEAFEYLCEVDDEFRAFHELFSRENVRSSMAMLTADEKSNLEQKLTHLLILLCPYLSKPKVLFIIDWLMRKYFIHAQYLEQFMMAVLPHHTEKFAMKLIQHLDWRFVDFKEWGWLKNYAVKGICISNEAFAKACVSSESGFLHRSLWNALQYLGQDEQRLTPYIQLYVTTMSNILDLPLGKTRWAKELQPALEFIERGLKRKACPCFASGMRIIMMKAARTMPLNPDLVEHWMNRLLRAAKKPSKESAFQGGSAKVVETVLLVKTLSLSQGVTLNEKSQATYNGLVEFCTEEQRDFLRNIERPSITTEKSVPTDRQNTSNLDVSEMTLLQDLSASSGRDSVDNKTTSSILEKVKQNKRKKNELAKKVKTEELQNIFMNDHQYTPEQIEKVLVRCLSTNSGLEWSLTHGLSDLLTKVVSRYSELQELSDESLIISKENKSDSEDEVEHLKDSKEHQIRSMVTLINQILLCLLSLCQTQTSALKEDSSSIGSPHPAGDSLISPDKLKTRAILSTLDVEPIFQCLTKVKELEVHRLVMQVVNELATLMPWTLVHHMMTVVTSMSHEVLPLDDESSLHLVSQLVSVAIPAYVKACNVNALESVSGPHSGATSLVTSAAVPLSVLNNFVPVWDTIPSHRRLLFYRQLVHSLSKTSFLFNNESRLPDKSQFLWILIILFGCEWLSYQSGRNKQEKLLNFLVGLIEEYSHLQQISTVTRIYEFLTFLSEDNDLEDDFTREDTVSSEQSHLILWRELKKLVHLKLSARCSSSHGSHGQAKRRRVTTDNSSSIEVTQNGTENVERKVGVAPSLIGIVASVHQKLITHLSKGFLTLPSLKYSKSSKGDVIKSSNKTAMSHPSDPYSIQLSLELKELVNHLMHLWQVSQAQPEVAEWRSIANTLQQLLHKLSIHLPLSTYVHVLLSIAGSQKPASVLGKTLSPSFMQNWPRLRTKSFELLLSVLRSGRDAAHLRSLTKDPSPVNEVYVNCLVRLQDTWVTTNDQDSVAIQMRCYCLLSIKELIKLLLDEPTDEDGTSKVSPTKTFTELSNHLCRYLTSKSSVSGLDAVDTKSPQTPSKSKASKRRSGSSVNESNSAEGDSNQEEFSLTQVVLAALLPHLHKSLLSQVTLFLLSSHVVLVHPEAGDLVATGTQLTSPDVLMRWSEQRWHYVLAALQLLAAVSTSHLTLLTEMMEEWQRGKLVSSFTTVFRMSLLLQKLLRKPGQDSHAPRLKESCAMVARQCLSQLQLIRDAVAGSSNCVEFLLELFKTKDYAVTRGVLSIATMHCRNLIRERESSGRRSDTSWDSDTHFLHMADLALDACDMTLLPSTNINSSISNENDMEVDKEMDDEDEETFQKASENPLWTEIERFLITLLLLPDSEDLEERVTLMQRLVNSSEKHSNHILRMKMLLGVITKFLPHTTPEYGEELVGRVGFNTLLDQGS